MPVSSRKLKPIALNFLIGSKVLILCDGGSSITHTVYAEIFNDTEPSGHAFTVATTNSTGGSGSGYLSLQYAHSESTKTYTFSGVATLNATQTI